MTANRTPSAPGLPHPDRRPPDATAPDTPVRSRPRGAGGGRGLRRVLAAAGVLVAAVLLAPTPLVRPLADRAARGFEGPCATFTGVEVDPGRWPVVARALAGRMRGVSTHADEVAFDNGAVFHDVEFSADQVNGPPVAFGLRSRDTGIRGGRSSATVHLDDLERSLADEGLTVDLHVDAGALVADVEVPVLGAVPTAVEVLPVDGDIELRFAPYDAFPLPEAMHKTLGFQIYQFFENSSPAQDRP